MKYLLDTHVLDWAQTDVSRLSAHAREIVSAADIGDLAIADVSITELARHIVSGRIRPAASPDTWLHAAVEGIEVLPVTPAIALRAARLEWANRDPCDRQIVASAIEHRIPLVTIDEKIHALSGIRGLKVVW